MLNQIANAGLTTSLPLIKKHQTDSESHNELNDTFMRNAVTLSMEEAVARHHKDLKKLEEQKKLEKADFNWRIQAEKDIE